MVDRGSGIEVVYMAGRALCGQADEPADRGADVAGIARHGRVRANQWESRGMFADGFDAILPAVHIVAIVALGAELGAVDVGVAIRALRSHIGENQLRVTQTALHFFVHASQRKFGLAIMVELGNGANGRPTRGSVATAARRLQRRSMRVGRRTSLHLRRLPLIRGHRVARQPDQEQRQDDFNGG